MDDQLKTLESDRKMIERRLFQFATEADLNKQGGLDNPALAMKRMPDDLKDVRKIRIGRHRIYFIGHHHQCSYHAFYIKSFKKTGVDDEDNPKHQKKLSGALAEPAKLQLSNPDKTDDSASE